MPIEWDIWLDANISPAIAKWMGEFTGYNVKSSILFTYYILLPAKGESGFGKRFHHNIIVQDSYPPELLAIYLRSESKNNYSIRWLSFVIGLKPVLI